MRLAAALKLKNGDRISFGDATMTRNNSQIWEGVVRAVTSRGGVRVEQVRDKEARSAHSRWVCYSHVIEKL